KPILEIINLEKQYLSKVGIFSKKEIIKAVDDVSFSVFEGETLGLVGESGCGKSTLGRTILQLEKATSGSIKFRGKELTMLSKREIRNLRKEIQIIFQDPYSSLNPRLMIGQALMEPMEVHGLAKTKKERKDRVLV